MIECLKVLKLLFMKLLILFLSLSLISCKREISSLKELVYFHIYVMGNPFVASIILDKPAESNFFATFNWFDTHMQPHIETLTLNTGETHAQDPTGIDSTGYMTGVEMIDWTKETEHFIFTLDRR